MKRLSTFRLLEGYRGKGPYDIDALVDLMVRLSDYVIAEEGRIKEVDLNPIMVYEAGLGAVAADALVVKYELDVQPTERQEFTR